MTTVYSYVTRFALAPDKGDVRRGLHRTAMTRKVLLVEFDTASQAQCARVLRDCACETSVVNSAAEALALVTKRKFDAMLVDFRLASLGGSDLPTAAKHSQPGINIILMVEGIGNPPANQPLRLRGYPLLTKPLKIEELTQALEAPPEAAPPPPPQNDTTLPASPPAEF